MIKAGEVRPQALLRAAKHQELGLTRQRRTAEDRIKNPHFIR